ncbi:MAG: RimJ/RimL family protein N-acetyltransferase [Paraglaciecola sp.]|jgi:RimJ/RimL family protein N-acetyltransferase
MILDTWLNEVELVGATVSLQPLSVSHSEALLGAASDGKLWELWYTGVPSQDTIDGYITQALADKEIGRAMPFVVVENITGRVLGCTRFCNAVAEHRRLEIGYTWYAKSCQRTSVNTQCKLLLLSHAFENLNTIAVEFRTHWHNQKSRNAIARLGAKQDGVLRNHLIEADGAFRDTVVFSIINSEWPSVKKSLQFNLANITPD